MNRLWHAFLERWSRAGRVLGPRQEAAHGDPLAVPADRLQAVRLPNNPIIRPALLPGRDGENINGPSLIRVPDWIERPLGQYYLYFAHHRGQYIRLAYADHLTGPWRVYRPGALSLAEAPGCTDHVASPDVIVDNPRRELRLYFHGPARAGGGQRTFLAVSRDGLRFQASAESLGIFYWRVFEWDGWWYAMAKGGLLYRSRDGVTQFEEGPNPLPGGETRRPPYDSHGPRHVAVQRVADRLRVYYSSIGDAPERILRVHAVLTGDWKAWRMSTPEEVLRPEGWREGVDLPVRESRAGAATGRERAVRDPAIFVDTDARVYLLYSVAGESGIAIAELIEPKSSEGVPTA